MKKCEICNDWVEDFDICRLDDMEVCRDCYDTEVREHNEN